MTVLESPPNMLSLMDSDGSRFTVELSLAGVVVRTPDKRERLVPWAYIVSAPAAWGVISDGWLKSEHPTERIALDVATDLRGVGCRVDVVRIPAELV